MLNPKLLLFLVLGATVFTTQAIPAPPSRGEEGQRQRTASAESAPLDTTQPLPLESMLQAQASDVLQLLRSMRPLIQQELGNWTQKGAITDPETAILEFIRDAELREELADVLKACLKLRAVLTAGPAHGLQATELLRKMRKRLLSLQEHLLESTARQQVPAEFNQLLQELGLSALDREEVIEELIEAVAEQAPPQPPPRRRSPGVARREPVGFPIIA